MGETVAFGPALLVLHGVDGPRSAIGNKLGLGPLILPHEPAEELGGFLREGAAPAGFPRVEQLDGAALLQRRGLRCQPGRKA